MRGMHMQGLYMRGLWMRCVDDERHLRMRRLCMRSLSLLGWLNLRLRRLRHSLLLLVLLCDLAKLRREQRELRLQRRALLVRERRAPEPILAQRQPARRRPSGGRRAEIQRELQARHNRRRRSAAA